MMTRANLSFEMAMERLDREVTSDWREGKPTFAEPTAGSLRTTCWTVPAGTSGIGLPAVGLAEAGGGNAILGRTEAALI